jgi:hypothetical protein
VASSARRGCFPGSFNPLTVAHLAVIEMAMHSCALERIDLVVSRVALAKEAVQHPRLDDRVEVLRAAAATRPWLGIVVTDAQLVVDIARGYDLLIVGADKWTQILDPVFYDGSRAAAEAAVDALPPVAVVLRPGSHVDGLPLGSTVLSLSDEVAPVSSTAVRSGRHAWMAPEAAVFDELTGAWSEPARYVRWLEENAPERGVGAADSEV